MPDHFELLEVQPNIHHIRILYQLLIDRRFSISHSELPSLEEHSQFVVNHPYRAWYIIKQNKDYFGSVYIANDNSIGISLAEDKYELVSLILKQVLKDYQPLPQIKSIRGKQFHINVNPNNSHLISELSKFGMVHIQSSYLIPDNL